MFDKNIIKALLPKPSREINFSGGLGSLPKAPREHLILKKGFVPSGEIVGVISSDGQLKQLPRFKKGFFFK